MPNGDKAPIDRFADWLYKKISEPRKSQAEQKAFLKWLERKYGFGRSMQLQLGFGRPWWESNPYYEEFLRETGYTDPGATPAPAPGYEGWQPTPAEGGRRVIYPLAPPTPPVEKRTEEDRPLVTEEGGYRWQATYDAEGEFVAWEIIEAIPKEPTPRAWQPGRAEWQQEFEAEQTYRQWQMRPQEQDLGAERQQREMEWRLWKTEREAELERGGPMNWIKLWPTQQGTSPYLAPRMTPEQGALQALSTIQEIRSDLLAQGGDIPSVEKLLKSPEAQLLAHSIGMHAEVGSPAKLLSEAMTYAPEILEQQKRAQEAETQFAMSGTWSGEAPGGGTIRQPTTPPAPAGLSKFATGQVTGQPITKEQVTTPSPQMWSKAPWLQREQLRGYMGWTGQPYRGMLEQMSAMMPQAPRGTARKRWQPTRQRV